MKVYIIPTFIGVFGVSEEKKVLAFKPFEKDSAKVAEKVKRSEIEMLDEEKLVRNELGRKNYREFVFTSRKEGARHVEFNSDAEQFLKDNLRKFAIEKKFVKDQIEFNQFFTKFNLELAKVKIKKAVGRDSLIVQANGGIEEIDKCVNIFVERLREWYGLHFPEMDRAVQNHEKFALLVEKFGSRENVDEESVKELKSKSMGADLKEEDIKTIQLFAAEINRIYALRKNLSKYLEGMLKEVAPNFTDLAGASLSAKLISKAGGLDKLARMPSSTIQLLGAEKALFRFLHGKGKSPRFGLIFNHQLVQNAPEQLKGKVARIISSKLSIAAKLDYYSKEYKGDKMRKEMEERINGILKSK